MADNRVRILIEWKDNASPAVSNVRDSISRLDKVAKEASESIKKSLWNDKLISDIWLAAWVAFWGIVFWASQSVNASVELTNSLTWLKSVVEWMGGNFNSAKDFIVSFTRDWLISTSEAATALKNLFARGFSLEQSIDLLNRFKDSASFGRQSALSLWEAVAWAAEWLKNENSMLVDNAWVTKNVAKMWEDYAKAHWVSTNELTHAQKLQAEYNGILEETRFQVWDAAKYTQWYAWDLAKQNAATKELKQNIWDALLPVMQELSNQTTDIVRNISDFVKEHKTLTATIITSLWAFTGLIWAAAAINLALPTITWAIWLLANAFKLAIIPVINLWIAFVATPFWAVIAWIAAVWTAMYLLMDNWDTIKWYWQSVVWIWNKGLSIIYEYVSKFVSLVWDIWNWFWWGLKAGTNSVISWLASWWDSYLWWLWEDTKSTITNLKKAWWDYFYNLWTQFADWVNDSTWSISAEKITAKLVSTGEWVVNYFESLWGSIAGSLWAWFEDIGADLNKWFKKIVPPKDNPIVETPKQGKKAFDDLKKTAEDAISAITQKVEWYKDSVNQARDAIIAKTKEWKQFKQEWVRALSDVNNEIKKLKDEAQNIELKFKTSQDEKLSERYLQIQKDIASIQEEMRNAENGGNIDEKYIKNAQLVNDLTRERESIEKGVSSTVIANAVAYDKMTETEKIMLGIQKEKAKELEENKKRLETLLEKQALLEIQANQKSISDLKINTDLKNGIITASYEIEKGKRQEIHDYENVQLALQIQEKQKSYSDDMVALQTTLQQKLWLEKQALQDLQTEYRNHNTILKTETKNAALEMIGYMKNVATSLREVIALKKEAGVSTVQALWVQKPAGERALWGWVLGNTPMLVGENGPEIFVPHGSWTIVPNWAGGTVVNINMWWVVIRNEMDLEYVTDRLRTEIIRSIQLWKLWIS